MFTLDQILDLVGGLDDAPGNDTSRERFRRFLKDSVTAVGAVRDYVEICTKNKGSQYDHALQDLVNHIGTLIGFDVEFGRYKGISNDIGHDGLWRWNDFSIVVEIKTTDAFAIKTETLLNYVNKLISAQRITDSDRALGLYVFARTDAELKMLANSVIAEKRTHELRISTVEDVLSLAELVQESHITPDEAVALLRPSGVFVVETVSLLSRIAAQATVPPPATNSQVLLVAEPSPTWDEPEPPEPTPPAIGASTASDKLHLLTPLSDKPDSTARETVQRLVGAGWYVFGDRTPGRSRIKPGDRICFYESGVGITADAVIASVPERKPPGAAGLVQNLDLYPWSFRLTDARFYVETPVAVNAELRAKLDAFAQRDPVQSWAWFVQSTRIVTKRDFNVLTDISSIK